jgi:hypothetical protein
MSMKIGTYAKFIVSLVGFLLTTALALDWGFEFPKWAPAASSLLTAVGVYLWPNQPYLKREQDPPMADPAPDPAPDLRRGELGHPDNLNPRPASRRYEDDIPPH